MRNKPLLALLRPDGLALSREGPSKRVLFAFTRLNRWQRGQLVRDASFWHVDAGQVSLRRCPHMNAYTRSRHVERKVPPFSWDSEISVSVASIRVRQGRWRVRRIEAALWVGLGQTLGRVVVFARSKKVVKTGGRTR